MNFKMKQFEATYLFAFFLERFNFPLTLCVLLSTLHEHGQLFLFFRGHLMTVVYIVVVSAVKSIADKLHLINDSIILTIEHK